MASSVARSPIVKANQYPLRQSLLLSSAPADAMGLDSGSCICEPLALARKDEWMRCEGTRKWTKKMLPAPPLARRRIENVEVLLPILCSERPPKADLSPRYSRCSCSRTTHHSPAHQPQSPPLAQQWTALCAANEAISTAIFCSSALNAAGRVRLCCGSTRIGRARPVMDSPSHDDGIWIESGLRHSR